MSSTYTTVQGDTWDIIAHKQGNGKMVSQLLEANPGLKDVFFFEAGQTIVVPEITETDTDPVPPWQS